MRNALIGMSLMFLASQAQAAYKCEDHEGHIRYTDTPCASNERSAILNHMPDKSKYLINTFGKKMASLIQQKAAQGDASALEIMDISMKMEAAKVYSQSRIFPIYLQKCESAIPDIAQPMKTIFDTYLKSNSKLLSMGESVAAEGIHSTVIPGMNLSPGDLEQSTAQKMQDVADTLEAASITELAEKCNTLMSSIDTYNRLLEGL